MTSPSGCSAVPPGFRFHPTDEELLYYYLKKKVSYEKIEIDVIRDVDLNKLEPWDLHERCRIGSTPQNEWYFFSHKDKKYPTGSRTNRATAAGFWKATGRDKAIHTELKRIGMRKTLVFYKGRAPRGQKTDWIMHEYRLEDNENSQGNEDGWVVCRVFKKRNHVKGHDSDPGSNLEENSSVLSEPKDGSEEDPQCIISQQQQQNYIYKPELPMQYNVANPQHAEQFMQMTQLEGKKLLLMDSCNSAPDHISLGTKRFFPERVIESVSKRIHYQLPINNNNNLPDMGPPATTTDAAAQLKELREQQLNDWAVLDRFVASHLNQEDSSSNEIRYHVGAAAAVNAPSGDHLPQQPLRGDQIDLWNFGK